MKVKLKRYNYPIKEKSGQTYYGSYTIKDEKEPLGFKDEKLIQKFTIDVIDVEQELFKD